MLDRESDSRWMRLALQLATQGQGYVEPNPMVGCVLVSGGQSPGELLGQGFHARFGEPHAERAAIADALQAGNAERLADCTAYVTLEPCCHFGKTPPCTDALIEAGMRRVVAAQLDPFDQVSGQGLARLRSAGIDVTVGVEQAAAEQLNAPYLKRLRQQKPWVIAKWAMSLDGKLATRTGDSQWISGEASRALVQQMRSRVDAILIGSGTALKDNPQLVARTPSAPLRTALRVVADTELRLPPTSQLARTAHQQPVLLYAGPQASPTRAKQLRELGCEVRISNECKPHLRLNELLHVLAVDYRATNLLVEGGGRLLGSLMDLRQIDQCEVFIAPKIIGGEQAIIPIAGVGLATLTEGPTSHCIKTNPSGDDIHISCRLKW